MTLIYSSCLLYWGQSFTGQSPSSASDSDSATERPCQQPGHSSAPVPSSAAGVHPAQQLLLDPHGWSWQAFLARTRAGGTRVSEGQLTSPTPKHSITALGFPKWTSCCLPSSAFLSHSTNFFICSRKTLFPLARCASLYHLRMGSSLRTSAVKMGKSSINTANCWEPDWQSWLPPLEAASGTPSLGTAGQTCTRSAFSSEIMRTRHFGWFLVLGVYSAWYPGAPLPLPLTVWSVSELFEMAHSKQRFS